jgi:hypothetical protein
MPSPLRVVVHWCFAVIMSMASWACASSAGPAVGAGAAADVSVERPFFACSARWMCTSGGTASGSVDNGDNSFPSAEDCKAYLRTKVDQAGQCTTAALDDASFSFRSETRTATTLTCADGEGKKLCKAFEEIAYWTGWSCSGDACVMVFRGQHDTLARLAGWNDRIAANHWLLAPEIGIMASRVAHDLCASEWRNMTDDDAAYITQYMRSGSADLAQLERSAGLSQIEACPDYAFR